MLRQLYKTMYVNDLIKQEDYDKKMRNICLNYTCQMFCKCGFKSYSKNIKKI